MEIMKSQAPPVDLGDLVVVRIGNGTILRRTRRCYSQHLSYLSTADTIREQRILLIIRVTIPHVCAQLAPISRPAS
jgi:microcystin degradation protein MlrC